MINKSTKSLTDKLIGLFFRSHKKSEEIKIYKGVWEEKEGVKWVYFKERSDETDLPQAEDPSDTLTAKNYAENIITKRIDTSSDKQIFGAFSPSTGNSEVTENKVDTFSVTEFGQKYGSRGEMGKNGKKESQKRTSSEKAHTTSQQGSDEDSHKNLDIENTIKNCIQLLNTDPSNAEIRKKLVKLYLEKNSYSQALDECYNLFCRLPVSEGGLVFSGDINYISPFYIFHILISTKQSGKVVFFLAGEEASVFFLQGKAVHAEDKWGKGEEVIKRILSWREGCFRFIPNNLSFELTLNKPIEKILTQVVGTPLKTDLLKL